jgi:hypothetical protein
VDNRAHGVETVCLNPPHRFIRVSWNCPTGALCSLQHNVFTFRFSWNHGGRRRQRSRHPSA